MLMNCSYHKKEHEDYQWRSNSYGTFCREAIDVFTHPVDDSPFLLGGDKKSNRVKHWEEIKSRIKTHDGEMLTGKAGREYQQKYSKRYLGRDLSQPTNFNTPEYQKELAKTR